MKDLLLKEIKKEETTFVVSSTRLGPFSDGTVEGFFHYPWMIGEVQIYLRKNPFTKKWMLWGVSVEEFEVYYSATSGDIPWLAEKVAKGIRKAYRDLVAIGWKIASQV